MRAKAAGCDEILPKPLRLEALRAVLDHYLDEKNHESNFGVSSKK